MDWLSFAIIWRLGFIAFIAFVVATTKDFWGLVLLLLLLPGFVLRFYARLHEKRSG